jgi:hypothetical protein
VNITPMKKMTPPIKLTTMKIRICEYNSSYQPLQNYPLVI